MSSSLVTTTIDLADFRAGIHSDLHGGHVDTSGAARMVNGAATIENTYRCHADPVSGALIPLPKGNDGYSRALMAGGNAHNTTSYYPTGYIADYLLDLVVTGPVYRTGRTPDEAVMTLHGFMAQPAGTGTSYYTYILGGRYLPGVPENLDFTLRKSSSAVSSGYSIPTGMMVKTRKLPSATSPLGALPANYMAVVAHQANWAQGDWSSAAVGATEQGWTSFDSWSANYEGNGFDSNGTTSAWFYPDTANTASHDDVAFTESFGFLMCGHQGRLVQAGGYLQDWDSGDDHLVEYLTYTAVSNIQTAGGTTGVLIVGEENPSSYGAMGSMNANELFLVKWRGGAILIRGDLDNPTVIRLPLVQSTDGITMAGCHTPLGFVYAAANGIYAWAGADTASKLSAQLDGQFFSTEIYLTETYSGSRGRIGFLDPFVLVPNSYLMDVRTQAWWRLEDTSTVTAFSAYDASPQYNRFYAGKYKHTSTDNVIYRYYDTEVLASSYSWQSQPLLETRDRRLNFATIQLTAQAAPSSVASQVKVTLTGYDEQGRALPARETLFQLASTAVPVSLHAPVSPNFTAKYVKVRIETLASSGYAPKIYSVRLGVRDDALSPVI